MNDKTLLMLILNQRLYNHELITEEEYETMKQVICTSKIEKADSSQNERLVV